MPHLEMKDWIAIGGLLFGALGFFFAIYQFFANRRLGQLRYKLTQLSDFNLPDHILKKIGGALVLLEITSSGKKAAEGIKVNLELNSGINSHEILRGGSQIEGLAVGGTSVSFAATTLNPTEKVGMVLLCDGPASSDQVSDLSITHKDGRGIQLGSTKAITFDFLGLKLRFDPFANIVQFVGFQFPPFTRL